MNYRKLGRSGLKVSEISLGSWITYGGTVEDAQSVDLIHHAFDKGINLFDTADVYAQGEAERVLGIALKDMPRNEVVVATKCMGRVWPGPLGAGLSRKHVFDAIEASLTRLGLDYVDLYQAHAPDGDTPLEETLSAFNDLVRHGKVRYLGLSNFNAAETVEALRICERNGWEKVISHQPPYNLLDRRIEPQLMPICENEGIGFIVYSPLAQGILTGKYSGGKKPKGSRATTQYSKFMSKWMTAKHLKRVNSLVRLASVKKKSPAQMALAWTLREPSVSSAIIGATTRKQLSENLGALKVKLSKGDLEKLDQGFPMDGQAF